MSETLHEPPRWIAADDSHLIWRSWDEAGEEEPLTLVYFRDSDDTHLLTPAGVEIVRCLQEKPRSLDELEEQLAAKQIQVSRKQLETFVNQLAHVGVLERV